MTATTKTIRSASLGDRYAELSVLVVTVIALALGWWLKTGVENRGLPFSAAGITAQTPAGWLVSKASGEEVLHVTDRTAKGFGTTYLIQQMPAAADANLGGVAGMLTLQRGSELTAYKVLNQQNVSIGGRQAVEIEYVYVEASANAIHAVLPAVVHGLDYVFMENGKVIVVSYRADQSVYEADMARFLRFLLSVKF